MDRPWTELPRFEAALMKKGLQPKEFERTLLSKISKIFENEREVVDRSVKISVECVRENVCIRENESKLVCDVSIQSFLD